MCITTSISRSKEVDVEACLEKPAQPKRFKWFGLLVIIIMLVALLIVLFHTSGFHLIKLLQTLKDREVEKRRLATLEADKFFN
ncbi:hypothetical protein L596_013684 [Steinernema carpocapsae]|uniref:Uncharacterized protein n=1 Tax=Steinernema carpocapsae TaxID=34508 RepID=A0A4U5P0W5_STECR|nr:hypothetical protein L596_013684 [Steinernema carpocapsae]